MVYWYYNKKTFNLDSRRLPNLPELYCKSSPWALISGDEANIQNDAEWNLKIASSSLAVGILKPVVLKTSMAGQSHKNKTSLSHAAWCNSELK